MLKKNSENSSIDIDVNINREQVEDAVDELNDAFNKMNMPNVTIRNNQNVYITMNYFNRRHEDYMKE